MNFKITRTLENKVFTTTVKFSAYGSADMDSEEEQALVSDFGAPIIDLGAISFSDKYIVDANKKIVLDVAGSPVSFILNSKKIEVKEGFETSYSIDANKVLATDIVGTLTTKELVAEAKCILFETKVKEAITKLVTAFKTQRTQFEAGTDEFTA